MRMIFQLFKWHLDINWYKFEKRWAVVFQIYPNAIHFNPPQFCKSLTVLSFPVFCLHSSIVLSRYFVISVNSMIIWSMLKLPKIAWPSPFDSDSFPSTLIAVCIQLFRESLSRIKCTRQSRKVIWDMINKLFLTTVAVEPTFVTFLQHSQT